MSTTRLQLEQLLSEALGDYLEFDTSTNVGAGSTIIKSTTLQNYDGASGSAGSGGDDYYNDWWVSFQEGANLSAGYRQVYDYSSTAGGWLYLRGTAMTAESAAITLRLHRFNPYNKWLAINRAIEQIYPDLYKPIDNQIVVTGNILPNAHFEDWADAATPDFYEVSNAAASAIATAGLYRGGGKSVRVIPSASAGYLYLRAQNYPHLLDLSGKTVDLYAWAYPETADDPALIIYTKNIAGSTQTLTSATPASSGQWNLLTLEAQAINDNLVDFQVRFRVATSTKYCYFDDAVLCGMSIKEYPLPSELQNGRVTQVRVQAHGYSSTTIPLACYDLQSRYWNDPEGFDIIREGDYSPSSSPPVYDRVNLYDFPYNYRRMRIQGYAPIPTVSADSSTIYLDGEKLNLITAKAAIKLYEMEQGPVSSQDKGRYYVEIARLKDEVRGMSHLTMAKPAGFLRTGREA